MFSVTKERQSVKPLVLAAGYLKETLVKRVTVKRYVSLGLYYYTQEQAGKQVDTGNLIELFLGAKNQLMILVFHQSYEANNPFLISEKSEEFKKFLESNLEAWLKQRLTMTAFCNAIYEKVKLKLLLENL